MAAARLEAKPASPSQHQDRALPRCIFFGMSWADCRAGPSCGLTAWGRIMKSNRWKSMSIDDLWIVHEEITATLSENIAAERRTLKSSFVVARLNRDRSPSQHSG